MATGFRIDYSRSHQLNANSEVLSGAKLYVYTNLTTTPVTLYSDRAVTTTAANPIVADSSGRFPVRYVAADNVLTLSLYTSADVLVWSDDYMEPVPAVDNTDLALYLPLAGVTPMTGPINLKEGAAVAAAASLDADAMTGNFVHITGSGATIATITLTQGYTRTLYFEGANTLTHSSNLLLGGLDLTTEAGTVIMLQGEGSGVTRLVGGMSANGRPLVESAEILIGIGDESTAITTGTAKITFRMPFAMYLNAIPRISLTTASSSGIPTFDVKESGTTIFSTLLTVDANETSSATAATAAVLSDTSLADNAVMTVDVTVAGTGATGAKLLLRGLRRTS